MHVTAATEVGGVSDLRNIDRLLYCLSCLPHPCTGRAYCSLTTHDTCQATDEAPDLWTLMHSYLYYHCDPVHHCLGHITQILTTAALFTPVCDHVCSTTRALPCSHIREVSSLTAVLFLLNLRSMPGKCRLRYFDLPSALFSHVIKGVQEGTRGSTTCYFVR